MPSNKVHIGDLSSPQTRSSGPSKRPSSQSIAPSDTTAISKEFLRQYQTRSKTDDEFNNRCRGQIDKIFLITDLLLLGYAKDGKEIAGIYESLDPELPTPSMTTIISLAIQLNKSRMLGMRVKTDAIESTTSRLSERIEKMEEEKVRREQELDEIRMGFLRKETALIKSYLETMDSLGNEIEEYKTTKNKQVEKQSLKLQYLNFKILYEIMFQYKEKGRLQFIHQPILKLEEFLGYNILVINQFLEKLIILQCHLSYLFRVELPHLHELIGFLPNGKFYDLIKKKQAMILGTTEEEEEDNEESKDKPSETSSSKGPIPDTTPEPPKDIRNPKEKLIKLGDAYKLPLSAKTLNYQRRARRISSIDPSELNNIPILKERSLSPNSTMAANISSATAIPTTGSTTGPKKHMIIIPHKIINKPFNKLSIKEFLKFLLVIVKVITNFQVFLMFTTNDNHDLSLDDWCNFDKLLREVVLNLDQFFNQRMNELEMGISIPRRGINHVGDGYSDTTSFQILMEHVYELLMESSISRKQYNRPMALSDLKLRDLILNQTKLNLSEEWDIVSEMI
ncbi:uncharacterized protein J8A68_004881 [[Candida] subhashii]|uniref:Uncharacterized protein n=1 Tax=[Candida] subhashii TaxID=561895 RepID=A0A8J5QIF8_9ASCO|nr:uncharacterized protein J8A68_004881 [[Candida] subhashii]KAG7661612.1 hypothetical protein J8A68_004881 [[Candida] subhashii]